MSDFRTRFEDHHWAALASTHGTSATYKSGGTGSGTSITILWDPDLIEPVYDQQTKQQQRKTGLVRANPSDVSSPSDRDTYTIDGTVYAVEQVVASAPVVKCQVKALAARTLGSAMRRGV